MQVVLTPAEMREADRRTIDAGTSFTDLVERAGRSAARVVLAELGGVYGRRAVIICGPGNNGADGHVAARVLRSRGVRCDVFDLRSPLDRFAVARAIRRCNVLVDAMYGTGFHGALEGDAAWIAEQTKGRAAGINLFRVVAIDIPSGVDGLTGAITGGAVSADHTVTFGALKPGLLFEPGRGFAGALTVAEIGLEIRPEIGLDIGPDISLGLVDEGDVGEWLPRRMANDHKWSIGPVMVIGGSPGMMGAGRLGAAAALRSGSGVVVLYAPDLRGGESPAESARQGWGQSGESSQLGESSESPAESPGESARQGWGESLNAPSSWGSEVITRSIPSGLEGRLDSESAEYLLAASERFAAVLIGPGLGTDQVGADQGMGEVVRSLLLKISAPIVLDADGLNALGGDIAPLQDRAKAGLGPVILTPHDGEFNRLFGEVGPDRVQAARRLANESRATVLLKGPTTVIAEPDGRAYLVNSGGPWLATAGSGDILAGIIAALLACGLPPGQAAAGGAWLHCRASDFAGHTCLVASDLLGAIPAVWRSINGTTNKHHH